MKPCPFCGHVNTEGVDECAECQQPLTDLHLVDPDGVVERGLLHDRMEALRPRPVITVPAVQPVGEVLQILAKEARGCVVVVDEAGTVQGIFSERDALMKLNVRAADLAGRPVAEFMTPDPECLQATAKSAFALHRMDVGHYRHVPIVDADGRPVAVISIRDILRYLTDKMGQAAH